MAILQLVDQLAELVKSGWSIPFTPYRAVRGSDMDQLIDRIRINVPSSIREGEQTLAERDRIIAEAKAEAEEIVAQALKRQQELLSDRGMLVLANQEQERIIARGQAEADRRVVQANEYAVDAMQELRQHLQSLTEQVDNGIRMISRESETHRAMNGHVDAKAEASSKEPAAEKDPSVLKALSEK